jgi:hypothetical protein
MSNVAYRVYQLRTTPPNTLHRLATGALVALLVLAALAAAAASIVRGRPGSREREETQPS